MVRRVLTTSSVSVEEESEVIGLCGSFFEVDRVKADTEVQQIAVVINWSSFIVVTDVFRLRTSESKNINGCEIPLYRRHKAI